MHGFQRGFVVAIAAVVIALTGGLQGQVSESGGGVWLVGTVDPDLAARGESPAAFNRRCIPPACVVHRSNTTGILPLLALAGRRSTGLGATRDFHHGLLGMVCFSTGTLEPAMSSNVTFDQPGTYLYHCTHHPWATARSR